MKEKVLKVLKLVCLVIASFNALMYYSMRPCWSGISKALGYEKGYNSFILYLPIIVFIIILLLLITTITLFIKLKKNNLWNYILLPINIIFSIAIILIFALGAKDYARFIFIKFLNTSLLLIAVSALLFFIFIYPKTKLKDSKIFKLSLLTVIVLSLFTYLFNLNVNYITYEPVVYAVENEYQIVFSSSTNSLGYVVVNNKKYYDLYAGSQKSYEKVHKVSVPMEELDNAKEYSIYSLNYIYRGPFGAIKGNECSKTYKFKPVDTSDGLTYYSFSDIHMDLKGAKNAISMYDDYEFLVLNGDIISDVETYEDANYVNKVAYSLTKGEIPVIYARGNHEIKGKYSEQLYKFVGSKNQKFYYNFYFKDVYGIVLDMGEDHDDDWWEYYGSADFDSYRNEQVEFLKNEIVKNEFASYKYRLAVCHIPLPFINARHNHIESKKALVEQLNKMNIDMMLTGHQHELFIFEPGLIEPEVNLKYNEVYGGKKYKGYLLDFNFPTLMISKHGYTQVDEVSKPNHMVGLHISVDFNNLRQTAIYNNVKHEKVSVVNPFYEKSYGDEIVISLVDKKFN
ncbi:MAG: metallophosphoesterase [Candidatus Caccosoma sp.]|nr:metallophosphoesterase [Candidatus Caccosoma sp.]